MIGLLRENEGYFFRYWVVLCDWFSLREIECLFVVSIIFCYGDGWFCFKIGLGLFCNI